MAKLQMVQKNPKLLQTEIMQDQRFMQVMAMLLGINLSAPGGEGEPMDVDPPVPQHMKDANVAASSISTSVTSQTDSQTN